MEQIHYYMFKSRVGSLGLATSSKGLAFIALPNESKKAFTDRIKKQLPKCELVEDEKANKGAFGQIEKYLKGSLKKFDLRLDIQGTPFQQKVLKQVAKIPYGKTKTYGEIAQAVGSPKAFRAVGSANAKNNLPLVIPCHRVVATTGMGGYGGGIKMKKSLLELEGAFK